MAEEAKWYVVHTYSGYENKVKANIEKTIENRKLQDQILEVVVPVQDVVEMKNGAKKVVPKKLFPGYVLIHMIQNDDIFSARMKAGGNQKALSLCWDKLRSKSDDNGCFRLRHVRYLLLA